MSTRTLCNPLLINTTAVTGTFGAPMPGRSFNSNSYKYGFNGKEKDDEVKGNGNSYDFGARIYDPRIGRWLMEISLTQTPSFRNIQTLQNFG